MFVFSGQRLREVREAQDKPRELLALESDLAASTITALETGHAKPSRAALLRLATALGVPAGELVEPDPAADVVAP